MGLTSKERRQLLSESHRLKPAVMASAEALSDNVIANIRAGLARHPLLKVRIQADTPAECDVAAADVARRVPCEIVKRIGRVVVLHASNADRADVGDQPGNTHDAES